MQSQTLKQRKAKDALEYSAWRNFSATYKAVYSHAMSDLRQYGLTPPQYYVLRSVGNSDQESLPMSQIARDLGVTYANVTMIVDNLEKRGYAHRLRVPEDRRLVKVKLSTDGLRLFSRISETHRKEIASVMRALSNRELEELISLTEKIRSRLERSKRTSLQ
ncbi:MAG: MarR family transcriptional regulator [Thaumarchaeota archaeon]|nr:MarR family transcriptional regulator [Nitrososphaerota archaeon]